MIQSNSLLSALKDVNKYLTNSTAVYQIPQDEHIYEINLNTREIEAPKFLGVNDEHNAEIVWFKMKRYYDQVDLYNATCYIYYTNKQKEKFIDLSVPGLVDPNETDMIYIPWLIGNAATKVAGPITFAFQFYMLNDLGKVCYVLNTKPANSTVLSSLQADIGENTDDNTIVPAYSVLMEKLNEIATTYDKYGKDQLYWLEV